MHVGVNAFSGYAVEAARNYVSLVEAQLSQAENDMRSAAVEDYRRIPNRDEADYDSLVGAVERQFEEDYRPILRFTEVIYVYLVFETYVSRHIEEVRETRHDPSDILKTLTRGRSLVDAAQIYLRDHAGISEISDEVWQQLREIGYLRNCVTHYSGVVVDYEKHRDGIYHLESRTWQGQSVGIEIDRYQKRDAGLPVIIHQRFLQYCLSLLEDFFTTLSAAVETKYFHAKGT